MPLLPGRKNIGKNIRELEQPSAHAPQGRPFRQALAIALKTARIPKRADGGHVGPLTGDTPGRADKVHAIVPDGSHVIPSDIVSYLGGWNNAAGQSLLSKHFSHRASGGGLSLPSIPHSTAIPGTPHISIPRLTGMPRPHITETTPHLAGVPKIGRASDMPHMTKMRLAAGGQPQEVPVRLSDGEYVFGPDIVRRIGGGDIEKGHRLIDEGILKLRAESIKHLKKLPPPVGSKVPNKS